MPHADSSGRRGGKAAWLLLAGLAGALLWAYVPTLEALFQRWAYDPQYSHGFVIPVFAALVLWFRRDRFPAGRLAPSWWGLAVVTAGAALRLFGAYYYYPWVEELSLLPTLAGAVLLAGGWPLARWSAPALLLAVFMLPLPYTLEVGLAHPLQRLATTASTYALQTLGFPAVAEGNIILVGDVKIGVLEACSGLGMLATFFALSTAAALVIRRPLRDKVILFVSAAPIGVLVNLVRITATGVLHCTAGSAVANLVFHDLAGWLMMPLAAALLCLELKFLQRLFVAPEATGPVPVAFPRPAPANEAHRPARLVSRV